MPGVRDRVPLGCAVRAAPDSVPGTCRAPRTTAHRADPAARAAAAPRIPATLPGGAAHRSARTQGRGTRARRRQAHAVARASDAAAAGGPSGRGARAGRPPRTRRAACRLRTAGARARYQRRHAPRVVRQRHRGGGPPRSGMLRGAGGAYRRRRSRARAGRAPDARVSLRRGRDRHQRGRLRIGDEGVRPPVHRHTPRGVSQGLCIARA